MYPNSTILLTIDVEDWFQVENFKQWIPFSSWSSHQLRVEKNTHRLLELFDAARCRSSVAPGKSPNSSHPNLASSNQVKATFFILGWIAERLPHLVREIHSRGHEVGSHGYYHTLCKEETVANLNRDLTDARKLLEDILGAPIFGYRAPSFSISDDILRTIADCGYLYDSSYNSFALHGRYGHMDLSQHGKKGIALQIHRTIPPHSSGYHETPNTKQETFFELPISNITSRKHTFPWGGGAYFRLMPLALFRKGVRFILRKERAYLFYMHPWEIDPQQPRVHAASPFFKFRHYVNLSKTYMRLSRFLGTFNRCHFLTCQQYLELVTTHHPS
ncbi:MAG: DUF3473 domain-containing protein [Thermodesulfobacteriota bacterium]|nr:DUF3473 domain-containing protein [Thermodesulfobacteriota bacterium]